MPIRDENKSRYPADWAAISRKIRERAGWACEWCGAKNAQPHPRTGSNVVLTVAHLDHVPENCADGNLAALCQACHLGYDAEQHANNARLNRHGTYIKGEGYKDHLQLFDTTHETQ